MDKEDDILEKLKSMGITFVQPRQFPTWTKINSPYSFKEYKPNNLIYFIHHHNFNPDVEYKTEKIIIFQNGLYLGLLDNTFIPLGKPTENISSELQAKIKKIISAIPKYNAENDNWGLNIQLGFED